MEKRCVITGLGAVTPLGNTVDSFWDGIKNGVCGIDYIKKFDTSEFKVKIAAEVKDFNPELYMSKKDVKRNDLFAIYGMAAGVQAFEDSGIDMEKEDQKLQKGLGLHARRSIAEISQSVLGQKVYVRISLQPARLEITVSERLSAILNTVIWMSV